MRVDRLFRVRCRSSLARYRNTSPPFGLSVREIRSAVAPKPLIHPNLAKLYRKKVEELETLVAVDGAEAEAVQLVRSLVERITLTPEAGQLRVDLEGDLAAILAIASNKKPAGESPDGLAQVKLVAGVGLRRGSPLTYSQI